MVEVAVGKGEQLDIGGWESTRVADEGGGVDVLGLLADDVLALCEHFGEQREMGLDLQPTDFGGEIAAIRGCEFGGHGRVFRLGLADHFEQILEFEAGGVGVAGLVEGLGEAEAGQRDMLAGGWRVLEWQAGGTGAGRSGPGRVVVGEIGLEILDRLAGITRLLDRAGLAEHDVIAELARQFHRQRLGVKRVGFTEVRLGSVGHIGVGLGFELLRKPQDFTDQRLFAVRREDAGGGGFIDCRGGSEVLLLDQRLGLEKLGFLRPTRLGEIRQQFVGCGDGGWEFLALQEGGGFEKQLLVSGKPLGGDRLVSQGDGLLEVAGAHLRLDLCQQRRIIRRVGIGEHGGTECRK